MTYTPQHPPPPNPYEPDPSPRRRIWPWIVAASSVAVVAVVVVPVVILAGSNGHARTTPALAGPSAVVAVPHDFRSRAVLERSIRAEMIHNAARQSLPVTIGPVDCVGIGVRHWECNVTAHAAGQPDDFTIDVRVTRDYQRWISTGR